MRLRKPQGRYALVPNQWSGSVQQYYHFLLGYLAPIIKWTDEKQVREITVRDCGPMNRWFDILNGHLDIEIMQVGHFLHVYAGRLQPCAVLRGMDFPEEFVAKDLTYFGQRVKSLLDVPVGGPGVITVLDRKPSIDFYWSSESEIDMSGSERRSVPNLASWAEAEQSRIPMSFFDATELSVREQVVQSSRTRVLVGQHGAGLANMVFMRPGGTVIEIHPPLPGEAVLTFKRLARACGHDYRIVPQAATHAPVDESLLSAVVLDAAQRTGVPV